MFRGRLTHALLRTLDSITRRLGREEKLSHKVRTGRVGEELAYFHLRQQKFTIVARNFRVPYRKGEVDLIAWDGPTLCFVEVKTRTSEDVATAEAAIDEEKRHALRGMARAYLRRLREQPPVRFDLVAIYLQSDLAQPEIRLYKGVFSHS